MLLAGAVWLCLPSPVGVSTLLVYALEGRQSGRALGPLKSPCLYALSAPISTLGGSQPASGGVELCSLTCFPPPPPEGTVCAF